MAGEGASAAALVFDSERGSAKFWRPLPRPLSVELARPRGALAFAAAASSSLGQQNQISQTKERGTREAAAAEATEAVFMKQAA